jgi:large subunit ribosomal protein L34
VCRHPNFTAPVARSLRATFLTGVQRFLYTSRLLYDADQTEECKNMKRTWQPKRIPRRREHGFLKRMSSRSGQRILKARRLKGRTRLTVV